MFYGRIANREQTVSKSVGLWRPLTSIRPSYFTINSGRRQSVTGVGLKTGDFEAFVRGSGMAISTTGDDWTIDVLYNARELNGPTASISTGEEEPIGLRAVERAYKVEVLYDIGNRILSRATTTGVVTRRPSGRAPSSQGP